MKKIPALFCAALCGVVLTLALNAPADDIKQGVATIVRVQGEASYTLGGGDGWHPLVAGKLLEAGSTIKTGPYGTVDVILGKQVAMPQARPATYHAAPAADSPVRGLISCTPSVEQNVVRLSPDTTLKIDKLTVSDTGVDTVSDTELDLQTGRIFAKVKKLNNSSKYLVKIPNGIAGVRGTEFTLGADGSAGCIQHAVYLVIVGSNGKPTSYEVVQGTQFNPATGQTEPLPQSVLDALNAVAYAASTTYVVDVSYAANWAQVLTVSPTVGLP
jgi:hypothetical protein